MPTSPGDTWTSALARAAAPPPRDTQSEIDRTLTELAALARDSAGDVRLADLASLARALLTSLERAASALALAELVHARAHEMSRIGGVALDALLEDIARGTPPRVERFERCEASFEEARALEQHAAARLTACRRDATLTHASAVLWVEGLRSKLQRRRASLGLARRPRRKAA